MRILFLLALALTTFSCAPVRAASPEAIKSRIQSLGSAGAAIGSERLLQPMVVLRFYEGRQFEPAWSSGDKAEGVVKAIRAAERDGLTPSDYHLESIEAALKEKGSPETAVDLEILLTDAVAGLVDHVRYGRVRPVALNPSWNVNPREGAPPLEQAVSEIASASPAEAIEAAKPDHFIYRGLVGALERLRKIEADGGWPAVPAGKPIKPGARDPRIPAVRARLVVSGELERGGGADSSARYDPALVEAVKLFQARHRLDPDGIIDKNAVEAMSVPVGARIGQVRVNLERARWVLPGLKDDFMLVNLPAFKTYLIRGRKNIWEARIQIGKEGRQTPSFRADLKTVVFNPDWTVPPTILEEDVLADMRKGKNAIAQKRLTILDAQNNPVSPSSIDWNTATPAAFPYTLRQPPGPDNALGRVKFLFPNKYSVYLHDTPHRELFGAEKRTFSSGCMRVERPLELAERLLEGQWTSARIQQALATSETQNVNLEHPLPILIVYWTVSVGASGEIRYMRDVYELDGPVLAALTSSAMRARTSSTAG